MTLDAPPLEVLGFGCFGKLPISREFIVSGPDGPPASGFDQWIGGGVGLAKARLGRDFDDRITSFPQYRFYWGSRDAYRLAGVICPSEDAAGRKHPFAVFAHLRGNRATGLETAIWIRSLQEQAAGLLTVLAGIETPAGVREVVGSARPAPSPPDPPDLAGYRSYLAERRGGAFWRDLVDADDDDSRYTIVQALVETLGRGGATMNQARFRGGIRYPLSRRGGDETALESFFWLDFTEQYLGQSLGSTWWFRSPGEIDRDRGRFLLYFSPPSDRQWLGLVDPGDDLESISYLERPYGTEPGRQRMNPDLRDILTRESSTLADYLQWARAPHRHA